jgi:hypothetical protein
VTHFGKKKLFFLVEPYFGSQNQLAGKCHILKNAISRKALDKISLSKMLENW